MHSTPRCASRSHRAAEGVARLEHSLNEPALTRYTSLRLAYCRGAVRSFQRRLFASIVVCLAVAGIGGPALVAGVVLPLYWALAHGAWIWAALAGYAVAGGMLVAAIRPLLWNPQWAQAERALPIRARDTLESDIQVVLLAFLPVVALFAGGTAVVAMEAPEMFWPVWPAAIAAMCGALLGAALIGVALLQCLRRMSPIRDAQGRRAGAADEAVAEVSWAAALVWTPLARGPARRTRRALALNTLMLLIPCFGTALASSDPAWWVAGYSLLSLVAVSRCSAIARQEFGALLPASFALPIDLAALRRVPPAIALVPGLFTMVALLPILLASSARHALVSTYATVTVAGWAVEAFIIPSDPAAKAARWLVTLALGVALASELTP